MIHHFALIYEKLDRLGWMGAWQAFKSEKNISVLCVYACVCVGRVLHISILVTTINVFF